MYANPLTGVLTEDDPSVPSALSVLPNVIEKSERVVIVHGLADFILLAEGTRIAIQSAISTSRALLKLTYSLET